MITPKNWMSLASLALQHVPVGSRHLVQMSADVLDPRKCGTCSGADFHINGEFVDCVSCQAASSPLAIVNLKELRPRVSFYAAGRRVVSAILVRHDAIKVVIPEVAGACFRVNNRSPANSPRVFVERLATALAAGLDDIR